MNDGTLIDRVVRVDDLRRVKPEEGIDGDKNNANGIGVNGASPLKVMIGADEKGRSNVTFPKGGEGAIIGLMD